LELYSVCGVQAYRLDFGATQSGAIWHWSFAINLW
jgi:hypothetical protein